MAITSEPLQLPVSVLKTTGEFIGQVGYMVVLPIDDLSYLLRALSRKLKTSVEEIIPFFECRTKKIVRIDEYTDLKCEGAEQLRIVVGIIQGACKECENAFNHGAAPEFHRCVLDKTISGFFKSPVGPVQRPLPATVQ